MCGGGGGGGEVESVSAPRPPVWEPNLTVTLTLLAKSSQGACI